MGQSAAKVLSFTSTGEVGGTWGSTGVATKKLHGLTDCTLSIVTKTETVRSVGWYGPGPVANEVSQSGEGNFEGVALYEDITNIMGGLFGHTSGSTGNSTGGSTAPYYYAWTAPVTSTQIVTTFDLEYGTTGQAYMAVGAIIDGITIKGEAGGYWTYSSPILAKQIKPLTGLTTAALIDRTVNPIKMADTSLYMDAFSTGTMGGTAISASLISFELSAKANRHMKTFAGSLYPGGWGDAPMDGSLKTVLEFNTTQKALVDELLGTTGTALQRQIRIKGSQGSSGTLKSAALDFCGIVSEPIKLWDDRDGNLTVELNWAGKYSTSISNWFRAIIECGSSSTT